MALQCYLKLAESSTFMYEYFLDISGKIHTYSVKDTQCVMYLNPLKKKKKIVLESYLFEL